MAEPTVRRSFGPVVLLGLATAALATVAASRTWLTATGDAAGLRVHAVISGSDAAPLALALALVALASWGVVLVTRTTTRRIALVIGLLCALGVIAATVSVFGQGHDLAARTLADQGASQVAGLGRSGWFWVTGLAALAQGLVQLRALSVVASWPTMSSRYDAPAGVAATVTLDPRTAEPIDLWKALDEGQDPTGDEVAGRTGETGEHQAPLAP